MTEMNDMNKWAKITIVSLTFLVILLGAVNLFLVVNSLSLVRKLAQESGSSFQTSQPTPVADNQADQPCPCSTNFEKTLVQERGVIKKLLDDRDLGSEYMYEFYFEKPFLLWSNATGFPQFVDSLELYPADNTTFTDGMFFKIDDYLNIPVEIAGELTWGYAESRVIKIQAITHLPLKSVR